MLFEKKKTTLPTASEALHGRTDAMLITNRHAVSGQSLQPPFPEGMQQIIVGMGCFWGAERKFWQTAGVHTTAVGYSAGLTTNPTYREVCSGMTGHNEVVLVVFDPQRIGLATLLKVFWESHDPTQGMRQGNDFGTQYRSGIYYFDDTQKTICAQSKSLFQDALTLAGRGLITTEILPAGAFYYAEDDHQQYLAKNPGGYCGLGGTGVSCPIGVGVDSAVTGLAQ